VKLKREGAFLIARINQAAGRIFANILREHKIGHITPAQGRILFVLWRKDNIPIQQLAKETSLSKSTLTAMLDGLERAGHIKRIRSKSDRREVLIKLTEKDHNLMDTYAKVSEEMTDIVCRGLSEEELDDLEDKLRKILDNLISCEAEMKQNSK